MYIHYRNVEIRHWKFGEWWHYCQRWRTSDTWKAVWKTKTRKWIKKEKIVFWIIIASEFIFSRLVYNSFIAFQICYFFVSDSFTHKNKNKVTHAPWVYHLLWHYGRFGVRLSINRQNKNFGVWFFLVQIIALYMFTFIWYILHSFEITDYGCPVRKLPSLHSRPIPNL